MIRSVAFLSLFVCVPAVAMDNKNTFDIFLWSQNFMYLGACSDREKLEKAHGRTFSMNTIFVQIRFKPYSEQFEDLDLIPYDYIHEKNEGDTIALTINGTQYTIRCKHLDNNHFWKTMKFEELVKYGIDKFSKRADWYPAGTRSGWEVLVNEKVIDPKSYGSQHGENKSPYVQ